MSSPLRRLLAASLVLLALASCGLTVAIAEPGGASTTITRAQAVAFAQAVNLQVRDLPGAEALPAGVERSPGEPAKRELQCGRRGKPLSRPVFDESTALLDQDGLLASAVVVMRSEALAAAETTALTSRRGRACLVRTLGEAESVEGKKTVMSFAVKVTWVSLAKTLGPGALGLHVLAKLPPIELPPPLRHKLKKQFAKPKATFTRLDATFFRVGPAEILFLRLGVKRFPPASESQVLSLLHSHAEAHKL